MRSAPLCRSSAQTRAVDRLAHSITARGIIPLSAAPDATHIANAFNRRRMETLCREAGLECPQICTPAALVEGMNAMEPHEIITEIRAARRTLAVQGNPWRAEEPESLILCEEPPKQ